MFVVPAPRVSQSVRHLSRRGEQFAACGDRKGEREAEGWNWPPRKRPQERLIDAGGAVSYACM